MNHERETFEQLTKLRAEYNQTNDMKVSEELNNKINHDNIIAMALGFKEEELFKIEEPEARNNISVDM